GRRSGRSRLWESSNPRSLPIAWRACARLLADRFVVEEGLRYDRSRMAPVLQSPVLISLPLWAVEYPPEQEGSAETVSVRLILNYCRQGGEHARGCWVVDLVLSKGR